MPAKPIAIFLTCLVTVVGIAFGLWLSNLYFNPKPQSRRAGPVTNPTPKSERNEAPPAQPTRSEGPPNIILIYADDIDCESVFASWPEQPTESIRFPAIKELAERGICFTNFHVTTPVCGPSRASLLSSQYAHRNRVCVNTEGKEGSNGFTGGYRRFNRNDELGVWMQRAGYETSWVGKYLHDGFSPQDKNGESWASIKPPGWQNFLGSLGGNYFKFGTTNCQSIGTDVILNQYRTDHEADSVVRMLDEYHGRNTGQPLLLCWAPFAAHLSNEPAISHERHRDLFGNDPHTKYPQEIVDGDFVADPANRPPAFQLPAFNKEEVQRWTKLQRDRLRAIQALDEGLAKIVDKVKQNGDFDNTIFIFTSDHGFSLGQTRHYGKRLPRDRVTRVPMIVAGPKVAKNQTCDTLLANIDIGPTLAEIAGGQAGPNVDGISFAPLLQNPDGKLTTQRQGIVIENWDRIAVRLDRFNFTYSALRTQDKLYCEWANGMTELFDVANDPEQLQNLYEATTDAEKQQWAKDLRDAHKASYPPVISRVFDIDEQYKTYGLAATFQPVSFGGLVEDDKGIAAVDLELLDTKHRQYWDGERWIDEPATVPAKLAQPNGILTRWSYELSNRQLSLTKTGPLKKRTVRVKVIARDRQGNEAVWKNATMFSFRPDDPETWIDDHARWQPKKAPFTITGKAADDEQVKRVEILVRDLDSKKFWNGTAWTEERVLLPVTSSEPIEEDATGNRQSNADGGDWVRWTYTFDGPQEGEIYICARAFDQAENWDDSVSFTIIPLTNKYPNRK